MSPLHERELNGQFDWAHHYKFWAMRWSPMHPWYANSGDRHIGPLRGRVNSSGDFGWNARPWKRRFESRFNICCKTPWSSYRCRMIICSAQWYPPDGHSRTINPHSDLVIFCLLAVKVLFFIGVGLSISQLFRRVDWIMLTLSILQILLLCAGIFSTGMAITNEWMWCQTSDRPPVRVADLLDFARHIRLQQHKMLTFQVLSHSEIKARQSGSFFLQ